ncbi:hypothetical protein [Streptomyces europaeiscabiei]|uniref:hypothetical protein n=1 Tax=Streptomyces europaeiscabiei TaxID=146819 RepID=UPI003990A982
MDNWWAKWPAGGREALVAQSRGRRVGEHQVLDTVEQQAIRQAVLDHRTCDLGPAVGAGAKHRLVFVDRSLLLDKAISEDGQTPGTCSLSQLVLPGMPLASSPAKSSFCCQAA